MFVSGNLFNVEYFIDILWILFHLHLNLIPANAAASSASQEPKQRTSCEMRCIMDNLNDVNAFVTCATVRCGTVFNVDTSEGSCDMNCFDDNKQDTAAFIKCETEVCGVTVNKSPSGTTVSGRQTCNLDCFFAHQGDQDAQLACMEANQCPSD